MHDMMNLGFPHLPCKLNYVARVDHMTREWFLLSMLKHSDEAEVLAAKGAPLCRRSWKNEAKSRPIDRPQLATSLPSATGRTTLGQEGAIIFGRAHIDSAR